MFTTGPIRYFYTSHKCFLGLMHWASKDSQFWESEQQNLRIRKCSQRAKSHAEDYWGEVELAVRVVWLQHWGFVVGKKKKEAKHQWQPSQASAKTKIVELQVHWSSINVPGKQTIVEINPKKHFVHRKNLMITPSLKSSFDKWKMSSWNSCCHFDRVDNIWCKLRIGTCLRV